MKYKGSGNNIYSSDNIDPEFIEYLYNLPAEFLEEMFMAWVMAVKNKNTRIKNIEIYKLTEALNTNKIDLTKIFKDKL